jgi:hypothetical protein
MLRIRAFQNPVSGFDYQLYIWDSEVRSAVVEVVFKECSPGARMDPAFSLDKTSIQELMDSLWQTGIRPSEGVASTGQIEAVQNHLKDMQRLVFGLLTKGLVYPGVTDGKD